MLGGWLVLFVNILLIFVYVGFVTFPLCYIGLLIVSPLIAARCCGSR
jgi:hypothetical protein